MVSPSPVVCKEPGTDPVFAFSKRHAWVYYKKRGLSRGLTWMEVTNSGRRRSTGFEDAIPRLEWFGEIGVHIMDTVNQPVLEKPIAQSEKELVERWLGQFDVALQSESRTSLAALFAADGHWRDLLAFTWSI